MTIEDKLDLMLLDRIIETYEAAVQYGNKPIKEGYERKYNMKKMYEDYETLSSKFMSTYVKDSDSKE